MALLLLGQVSATRAQSAAPYPSPPQSAEWGQTPDPIPSPGPGPRYDGDSRNAPAGPPHAARVALDRDGAVQICGNNGSCQRRRHPLAAGKVRELVVGRFVEAAQASWIALAEQTVSLCYLNESLDAITCTPIANGAEFARGTRIAYLSFNDGSHTLRFAAEGGNAGASSSSADNGSEARSEGRGEERSEARWEASHSPYQFMTALASATDLLTRHALRHRSAKGTRAYPALLAGGGADICATGDRSGVTCTGSAGESGGRGVRSAAVATGVADGADGADGADSAEGGRAAGAGDVGDIAEGGNGGNGGDGDNQRIATNDADNAAGPDGNIGQESAAPPRAAGVDGSAGALARADGRPGNGNANKVAAHGRATRATAAGGASRGHSAMPTRTRVRAQPRAALRDPRDVATVETGQRRPTLAQAGTLSLTPPPRATTGDGGGGDSEGNHADAASTASFDAGSEGAAAQASGCAPTMYAQMAMCNDMGRRFGDKSRQACVNVAQSTLQSCLAAPGASPN